MTSPFHHHELRLKDAAIPNGPMNVVGQSSRPMPLWRPQPTCTLLLTSVSHVCAGNPMRSIGLVWTGQNRPPCNAGESSDVFSSVKKHCGERICALLEADGSVAVRQSGRFLAIARAIL